MTPTTVRGLPAHGWGLAPDGLATREQLRAAGLRPVGEPVAVLVWRGRRHRRPRGEARRTAWLYDVAETRPRRVPTPGRLAQLAAARARRQVCPTCGENVGYIPPRHLGECLDCADTRVTTTAMGGAA